MVTRKKTRLGFTARVTVPATLTVTAEKDPNAIEIFVRRDTMTVIYGQFFRHDWPEDEGAQPAFLRSLSTQLRDARSRVINRAAELCRKTLTAVPADPLSWGVPADETPRGIPATLLTLAERARVRNSEQKRGEADVYVHDDGPVHLSGDDFALFATAALREGVTTGRRRTKEMIELWGRAVPLGPGHPLIPFAFSGDESDGQVWLARGAAPKAAAARGKRFCSRPEPQDPVAVNARYFRIVQTYFPGATFSAVKPYDQEVFAAHQGDALAGCAAFITGRMPEGVRRMFEATRPCQAAEAA